MKYLIKVNTRLPYWVTLPAFTVAILTALISGCAPVAAVGGTFGAITGYTLHCYGLGFSNNCPTPIPEEIIAARKNDSEAIRKLIAEHPRIVKDAGRLDPILAAAASSDALDVIRLFVPTYAAVDRELSHPTGGTMLSYAVSNGGCNTAVHLLEYGAKLPPYDPLRSLVFSSTLRQRSDACFLAAKKLIEFGYKPSSRELSASLGIALGDGWEGKQISDQWIVPNYEMAGYLRSLGAEYLPPAYRQ